MLSRHYEMYTKCCLGIYELGNNEQGIHEHKAFANWHNVTEPNKPFAFYQFLDVEIYSLEAVHPFVP